MVCLHGFMDTWRSWELVLPALEQRHDVLALTLPGHAGGVTLEPVSLIGLVDAVERSLDEAAIDLGHLVGNSLGGYVALQLAARGRAASVVAFAPAGGWAPGSELLSGTLAVQRELHRQAKLTAPQAGSLLSSIDGRRRATQLITNNFEHIPQALLAHQMLGVAGCRAADALIEAAATEDWSLPAQAITCPVRIVWGTADQLLPLPAAATRFRDQLPQADWVLLDDVGHCPQLDVPIEAAQLIVGWTAWS